MSIADERATLAELRSALFGSGFGAILISALLIMVVVRRGVAPLQALSIRVADLDESNLGERMEAPDVPAELVPIVTALEATRARLSRAFQRERRFTADAAHELRTPLAGLRATLEVALRRERTIEAHREYAGQCLAVARSMEETLEGLLMLARAEEIAGRLESVNLADELEGAFVGVQPGLDAKELTLTIAIEPGLSPTISSVAALVERIVSNLARNVVAHATPGSAVTCGLRADGTERVAITVTNDCAPPPPETSERAFEAFWRADMARAGEGEHVGLGAGPGRQGHRDARRDVVDRRGGRRRGERSLLRDGDPPASRRQLSRGSALARGAPGELLPVVRLGRDVEGLRHLAEDPLPSPVHEHDLLGEDDLAVRVRRDADLLDLLGGEAEVRVHVLTRRSLEADLGGLVPDHVLLTEDVDQLDHVDRIHGGVEAAAEDRTHVVPVPPAEREMHRRLAQVGADGGHARRGPAIHRREVEPVLEEGVAAREPHPDARERPVDRHGVGIRPALSPSGRPSAPTRP